MLKALLQLLQEYHCGYYIIRAVIYSIAIVIDELAKIPMYSGKFDTMQATPHFSNAQKIPGYEANFVTCLQQKQHSFISKCLSLVPRLLPVHLLFVRGGAWVRG